MSNSPPRPAQSGDNEILLSPLMTLMPTGYRNIQPFQKGKGWHTNGRTRRAPSTQPEEAVVFPPLPGQGDRAEGPNASAVEAATPADDRQEEEPKALLSPKAPSTPKSTAPRRPSRTDSRGSSSSFRSRTLSPSNGNSRPASPATSEENLKAQEAPTIPGPDPVIMQQLWQEYAARSHAANRTVDAAAYHEKMHRRYGEQRALKERIAQLEQALEHMELERNQAQGRADAAAKQVELLSSDRSTSELSGSSSTADAIPTTRSSFMRPTAPAEPTNAEEKSFRERSFVLERALAQAKASLVAIREQLLRQTSEATERVQALEAQLVLERHSSLELARQLREASVGFTRASAELVETRVALEREQQRAQEVSEQARVQNAQLLSDTRRAQLETRMKLAVRSLGREAMRHKLEAFMSRTLRAEQSMRVAQLETERVRRECDATHEQLEQVLSSHAIKYHSLGAAGGVPGILKRGTTLSNRSRMVSGQLLLLQVLYEETEEPEDPDDAFSVHFVAYEPRSAQDDFLTFRLRDIQRLVPNHDGYLAQHSVRRRERLEELAEILLRHVHAGYKNGHLILAETSGPEAATRLPGEQLSAQQEQQHTRRVLVYRGTRYIRLASVTGSEDAVLAELTVNEAFAAATSQVWWLEVHAVMLADDGNYGLSSLSRTIDLRQLLVFCSTFGSYRPSEALEAGNSDEAELFAVHEALLEPLLDNLHVVISDRNPKLEIANAQENAQFSEPQTRQRKLSVELHDPFAEMDTTELRSMHTTTLSTLTYQCVVNVGDVFYCVRIQELWDGELLLDVTMDDPDTQYRFHRVLHESQLAKLAARLVQEGAIEPDEDEDDGTLEERKAAALQVKYGLAKALYQPLCRLIKRHIQPVLPHPSHGKNNAALEGDISLGNLLDDENDSSETRHIVIDRLQCGSLASLYGRELCVIGASKHTLPDDQAVFEVLQQLLSKDKSELTRRRSGGRFQELAGFAFVESTSATLPRCGNATLVNVFTLSSEMTSQSKLPLVLLVNSAAEEGALEQACKMIGLSKDDSRRVSLNRAVENDGG